MADADLRKLLHAILFTPNAGGRWGLAVLFRGGPGTGKTATVRQVAAEACLPLEVLSPGERGEGAFGVTPVPYQIKVGEEVQTMLGYPPPEWVQKFIKSGRGLVFLDEMSSAPPALQPPMLSLLQGGMIGGYTLPKGVRCLGAANPTEQAAGGWDLAMPVANRMGHINWDPPSAATWSDWLLSSVDGSPESDDGKKSSRSAEAEEARVLAAWPTPWARARGTVAGFTKRRSDLLYKPPEVNSPAASGAWPSPRSWENATRAIASAEVHGLSAPDRDALVAAFVSEGAASELMTWIEKTDLPDPAEILDGKIKWKHDVRRLDVTEAVLSSCTALITSDKDPKTKQARADRFWGMLSTLADDAADIVEQPATVLSKARILGQAAVKALAKLNMVITAADTAKQ